MKRIQNILKLLTVGGALVAALTGCGKSDAELETDVGATMAANLTKEFQSFHFEKNINWGPDPAPTMVFQGKNSTILAATKPYRWKNLWSDQLIIEGLAQTKSGRFFSFRYYSVIELNASIDNQLHFFDEPCLAAVCRWLSEGSELSNAQAKSWLFHSKEFTPELYEKIFKEPAPPKHIDA